MKVIFDLVVSWIRRHVDVVKCEVFRYRQQILDHHAAVVTASFLIRQVDGALPAVEVEYDLEGVSNACPGTTDSYHRVVRLGVVQLHIAAPFRVEANVPVGRDVSYRYAPYTRNERNPCHSYTREHSTYYLSQCASLIRLQHTVVLWLMDS